jgi:ABC-2 type transport system ATP-binding protein
MIDVISVKNFSKSFDDKKVIDSLSFDVKEGDIFAFLGQNGSGKTTTLRCLLNIYSRDSGELLFMGQNYSVEMAKYLGYLPEERGLYTNSKVMETLEYFGQIKGLSYNDAKSKGLKFLKRVGLEDKADELIKKLSSGQQQKIQLGITVINDPKILILDEPTKGLDPVNRSLLLDILMELNDSGSTILFCTHQMEEAERIASRLLMIKNGKSVLYGETEQVKKDFGENTIKIEFKGKFPKNEKLYSAVIKNNYAELNPNDNVSENDILKFILKSEIEVRKFEIASPSLNEIFIKLATD